MIAIYGVEFWFFAEIAAFFNLGSSARSILIAVSLHSFHIVDRSKEAVHWLHLSPFLTEITAASVKKVRYAYIS